MNTLTMTLVPLLLWAVLGLMIMLAAVGFIAGCIFDSLKPETDEADTLVLENTKLWRDLAAEQQRADQWRTLYERQLGIDNLSPAGRNLEERAIAKQAAELRGDGQAVAMRWKTSIARPFKAKPLPEVHA